ENGVTALLSTTARQFQATEPILRDLARTDLDWSASLSQRLNTRLRRERALDAVIESRCKGVLDIADVRRLLDLSADIRDQDLKDESLLEVVYAMAQKETPLPELPTVIDE